MTVQVLAASLDDLERSLTQLFARISCPIEMGEAIEHMEKSDPEGSGEIHRQVIYDFLRKKILFKDPQTGQIWHGPYWGIPCET